MLGEKHKIFNNWNRLFALLVTIITLFLLLGCATGGNLGRLEGSRDLYNMYLKYEVLPDHRYYTSGGYDAPDAILAIHTDYELDNSNNLWLPIPSVDSSQMRIWIDTIAPEQNYGAAGYSAAYILNPEGKRVGAWYSIQSFTTVDFLEGNKILVYTPDPGLEFRRMRRRIP